MQVREEPKRDIYRGRVVYMFAYDLAYDMKRDRLGNLLGQHLEDFSITPSKRTPRQLFFYRPQMIRLPAGQLDIDGKTIEIQRSIKVFNIGAISIQISIPFEVENIKDLVKYHEMSFGRFNLKQQVRNLAEDALRELSPYCVRPVTQLGQPEEYTVFCFDRIPDISDSKLHSEEWLMSNRQQVAALLTEEGDASHLSEQEAKESTELYLTYYYDDIVVVDWDAGLIVGLQDNLDEVLHIMELANVQLVELAAYDRILDAALERAYRDLAHPRARLSRQVYRNLREIRIDLERFSDELSNITKFFGDWHWARIYQSVSKRFHLPDWHRIINEKLKTLGELYQFIQQDRINFWMMFLEATIVLLFIIDLLILLYGLKG
jgi:hypothetical protein